MFSHYATLVVLLAAALGGLGFIGNLLRKIYKTLARFGDVYEVFIGTKGDETLGRKPQAGVMTQLDTLNTTVGEMKQDLRRVDDGQRHIIGQLGETNGRVTAIEGQFRRNGGHSMRDAIDRIEASGSTPPQEGTNRP